MIIEIQNDEGETLHHWPFRQERFFEPGCGPWKLETVMHQIKPDIADVLLEDARNIIKRAFDDTTKDIVDVRDKIWMRPSICSHLVHKTGCELEMVEETVDEIMEWEVK